MISIGQFSKVCGVSIQTLRYYDQIGLISPAHVNAENGYRYYSTAQIQQLLLISRLKRYGLSLLQIQQIMKEENVQVQLVILKRQQEQMSQELIQKQAAFEELSKQIKNIEQGETIMSYPEKYNIDIVNREDLPIISCRQKMSIEEFGKYFSVIFSKANEEHVTVVSQPIAIYHDADYNPENTDIEVALVIKEKEKATRILQGGTFAHTVHYGGYSNLPDAYGALTEWIEKNGYKIDGAPFEEYDKSNLVKLPIEKWETSVYFPITK